MKPRVRPKLPGCWAEANPAYPAALAGWTSRGLLPVQRLKAREKAAGTSILFELLDVFYALRVADCAKLQILRGFRIAVSDQQRKTLIRLRRLQMVLGLGQNQNHLVAAAVERVTDRNGI